jgi:hypothetical protein
MGGHLTSGPVVGHWTAKRVNGAFFEGGATAIGLERDGKLVAGVMYENWNGKSLMAHMAVEGRLTRDFIGAIFTYPFITCGVNKIICPISAKNSKSIKLVLNMGFICEGKIADAHPDGDVAFYTLTRANCRFIGDRYGKKRTLAAAGT